MADRTYRSMRIENEELRERLDRALTWRHERADKIREQDERIRQLDALAGEMTGAYEMAERERNEWKEVAENWKANAGAWSDDWHELKAKHDALAAHVQEIKRVRSIPRAEVGHDGRRVQLLIEAIDKPSVTGARPSSEVQQLRARVAYLEARLAQASEEGCALTAHVELLRSLGWRAQNRLSLKGETELSGEMAHALESTPETSLARLIAEKQAEAYALAAQLARMDGDDDSRLLGFRKHLEQRFSTMENELRRQAQGANSEVEG